MVKSCWKAWRMSMPCFFTVWAYERMVTNAAKLSLLRTCRRLCHAMPAPAFHDLCRWPGSGWLGCLGWCWCWSARVGLAAQSRWLIEAGFVRDVPGSEEEDHERSVSGPLSGPAGEPPWVWWRLVQHRLDLGYQVTLNKAA